MGLAWGQNNCTADDGTEGIELWGICYSIENTTEISENGWIIGEIPPYRILNFEIELLEIIK